MTMSNNNIAAAPRPPLKFDLSAKTEAVNGSLKKVQSPPHVVEESTLLLKSVAMAPTTFTQQILDGGEVKAPTRHREWDVRNPQNW